MQKHFSIFIVIILILLLIDQGIKHFILALANPRDLSDFVMIADMPVISIALVFNTGVAFSFLTWLGESLKFIQIAFLLIVITILYTQKQIFRDHYLPFAFMFGGGISNIIDRFLHGGVVDYIYWHYLFDFPIFNFADIIIDCGIGIFILQIFLLSRKAQIRN